MEDAALFGTVFDTHEFRGRAFAQGLKTLDLFHDCVFQPHEDWSVEPSPSRSSGTPISIYSTGTHRLAEDTHRKTIEAIRQASPDTPVVAMCDTYDQADIAAAVAMGLHGVIPTCFTQDVVVAVFRMVLAGGRYFPFPHTTADDPSPRYKVLSDAKEMPSKTDIETVSEDTVGKDLTPRQGEVLQQLREGESNKAIARKLDISEATVKIYVRQLLHKFRAVNRTQIVINSSASLRSPKIAFSVSTGFVA